MLFAIITFLSAFFIEGIGTYISILGLSSLFAFNPIIIAMAVALDVGKLVTVSFIYKYWGKVNILMRTYMSLAAVVLVLITSMGAFGFLSGEFQKAIATNSTQNVLITSLTEEKARLQKRKDQIDEQIAKLPATYSRGRVTVINSFKEETTRINARLAKIDEELPALKVQNIEKSVKIGPILYVAEAFNTTPEVAVKWVILTIIFVFDPLAIALLLAGNFLLMHRGGGSPSAPISEAQQPGEVGAEGEVATAPRPSKVVKPTRTSRKARRARAVPAAVPETAAAPADAPVSQPAEEPRAMPAEVAAEQASQSKPQQLTIEENPNGPDLVKREVPTTKFEAVNGAGADVYAETDLRRIRGTQDLTNHYRSDVPGVSVGGPFRR